MIMAAMAIVGLATASCTKDNAKAVIGTYDGTVAMSVAGQESGTFDGKVIIAEEAENTVTVTVPEVTGGHIPLPATTVTGVSVAKDGDAYTLSRDNISTKVGEFEVTGTLSGTVTSGKLSLTYTFTIGSMPMPITFVFTNK